MFKNFFFRKSCRFLHNVGKYCSAGQATGDNMAYAHCMLDNYGYKHNSEMSQKKICCFLILSLPLTWSADSMTH
jgi:hypothetical protein